MWCCNCQNDLTECTCSDIKERLRSLKSSNYRVMKWCSVCDNHYSQCKCKTPIWTTNVEMGKKEN